MSVLVSAPLCRGISGLEPDKFDAHTLNINPGHLFDFYGHRKLDLPIERQINLLQLGVWGIDAPVRDGELYIYAISNPQTYDFGLIASQAKFQGDVVVPAGYQIERKLPWGVMYSAARGGIPNFHLTHWPMPEIRFTDAEYSAAWMPVVMGGSQAWENVDVSGWVPDNARLAYLMIESRYDGVGTAGSTYVRSYEGQPTGLLVGSVSPGSPFMFTTLSLRIDSLRKFQYRVAGTGCKTNMQVLGYSMTEPA